MFVQAINLFLRIIIEIKAPRYYNYIIIKNFAPQIYSVAQSEFAQITGILKKFLVILIKYQTIHTKIVYNTKVGNIVIDRITALFSFLLTYHASMVKDF